MQKTEVKRKSPSTSVINKVRKVVEIHNLPPMLTLMLDEIERKGTSLSKEDLLVRLLTALTLEHLDLEADFRQVCTENQALRIQLKEMQKRTRPVYREVLVTTLQDLEAILSDLAERRLSLWFKDIASIDDGLEHKPSSLSTSLHVS